MSERCERCRKGFGTSEPREDIEWLLGASGTPREGERQLRVARCTRCSSYLVDVVTVDRDRPEVCLHDVCVVQHESARVALLDRTPLALAALSPQLRRRHLEELCAEMPTRDRDALGWIEQGSVACTELFRALVTRVHALAASELPALRDGRPAGSRVAPSRAAGALRAPLELDDGTRVIAQEGEVLQLVRMRGDRALWRATLEGASRDVWLARARGAHAAPLVAMTSAQDGDGALAFVLDLDGGVRGRGPLPGRAAPFEATALARGCVHLTTAQSQWLLREDATALWQSSSNGFASVVGVGDTVQLVDATRRVLSLSLPDAHERWALPVDRGAQLAPSGEGCLLLASSEVILRVDVRGQRPAVRWITQGASPMPLRSGGVAVVRDRWEKNGRRIECVVVDGEGRRRFVVARPEATKVPTAELGPGVLLYHQHGDVAVSAQDRVTYAVSVPQGRAIGVVIEEGGAWIEFDGIVDRVDSSGRRVARYRVG
jgi:hypothetical protein